MSVPCTKFIEGSFSAVKNQETVDFLIASGMPADESKKQLGSHWSFTLTKVPTGFFCTYRCEELPEFNGSDMFILGVEHVIDSVLFGGKTKILFNITGDNHFNCKADSVAMGKLVWEEDYSAEGLTTTMEGHGKTLKEFWKRDADAQKGSLVEGSYICVKDKTMGDFLAKTGMPTDACKKMVGSKWTCTIKLVSGGYLTSFGCKDFPEWSGTEMFPIGKETEVDSVMFGGKAKINFQQAGENHFDCTADTANMGKMSWTEDYSIEGLTVNYSANGSQAKEFWQRQESMEGWYKYDRAENVPAFCKATGADPNFEKAIETMESCFKKCKDGWVLHERAGTAVAKNFFKMDEEFDYEFPAYPQVNAKVVVTKVDGQTIKMIVKKKDNGRLEDWTFKVCPLGAMFIGTDKASGVSMKIFMKKFTNVYGTFNLVAQVGMEPVLEALGVAPDAAKTVANEDSSFDLIDMGDGNVRFNMRSKLQPMDMTFKWDEEYEIETPLLPGEKLKCVSSLQGNKMVGVTKSSTGTMRIVFTYGDTFCMEEASYLESGMSYKAFFEKV